MTAREQTGDREFYRLSLAHDNFTNLLCEGVNLIRHLGIICGNNAIRKQDMQAVAGSLTRRQRRNFPKFTDYSERFPTQVCSLQVRRGTDLLRRVGRLLSAGPQ